MKRHLYENLINSYVAKIHRSAVMALNNIEVGDLIYRTVNEAFDTLTVLDNNRPSTNFRAFRKSLLTLFESAPDVCISYKNAVSYAILLTKKFSRKQSNMFGEH